MSVEFIRIADEHDAEPIEIPSEENGTLFLSSVSAQFPGVCGLKYRNPETQTMRGIKLLDGVLYPPDTAGESYWKNHLYITVYPKDNKRKMEDEDSQSIRSKRPAQKCSDLIVLGLPWKVDENELEEYFKSYGDLVMKMIKRDDSGKSKGYGFIRFANHESQEQVVGKPHFIEGRKCEVKIPHSKEDPRASNKIFVGRISETMTREDLRSFFEQFGTVDDVFIPAPFRSFAFVTFRDNSIAQKLIGEDHVINGVSVYINNADPKGSKDQGKGHGGGMMFPYGGGRGSSSGGASRYYGGGGGAGGANPMPYGDPRNTPPFSNPMSQSNPRETFNAGAPNFNNMNPDVIAAALTSWNTMIHGMFASGANQPRGGGGGGGWQNKDMKKEGNNSNWGGKGDSKWS